MKLAYPVFTPHGQKIKCAKRRGFIKVAVGDNLRFEAAGLDRKHWSNAGPIRAIFREAFGKEGLPSAVFPGIWFPHLFPL
jgi:hypothetical protein